MIRQHGKLTFLSFLLVVLCGNTFAQKIPVLSLIHISEPTRH